MKQYFMCSNYNCKTKSKEYPNMRMKELYNELNKENISVDNINESTYTTCPNCGQAMVYVSEG